MGHKVSAKL